MKAGEGSAEFSISLSTPPATTHFAHSLGDGGRNFKTRPGHIFFPTVFSPRVREKWESCVSDGTARNSGNFPSSRRRRQDRSRHFSSPDLLCQRKPKRTSPYSLISSSPSPPPLQGNRQTETAISEEGMRETPIISLFSFS